MKIAGIADIARDPTPAGQNQPDLGAPVSPWSENQKPWTTKDTKGHGGQDRWDRTSSP